MKLPPSMPRSRMPDSPANTDDIGFSLGLLQAVMLAYMVCGVWFEIPFDGGVESAPWGGRAALFWRSYGMFVGYATAILAALVGARRRDYTAYVWACVVTFCLTVAAFALLSAGTTYVFADAERVATRRVRIDAVWPLTVPAWFLFCHPVLILLTARRAAGRSRASAGGGG